MGWIGRLTGPAALCAVSLSLLAAASAEADLNLRLDEAAIGAAQCTPSGSGAKVVVDVRFVLENYGDSGFADEWALDRVTRHLRIWRHSDGTYCAQVDDAGSTFTTLEGSSPSGTSYIQASIKGRFRGGYVTTAISGRFKSRYATHGNLGTFDTRCDSDYNCPGKHPAWTSYFVNANASTFTHYGWLYDAGTNGRLLDQDTANQRLSGDITAS